jgi:hypothetical protein
MQSHKRFLGESEMKIKEEIRRDTLTTDEMSLQVITDAEVLKSLPYELAEGQEFISYHQLCQGLLENK